MRIAEIRTERLGAAVRASATIAWEDSQRPDQEVFFEIETPDALPAPAPDAFLAALAVPALSAGERRIAIHGAVCPRMRDGVV